MTCSISCVTKSTVLFGILYSCAQMMLIISSGSLRIKTGRRFIQVPAPWDPRRKNSRNCYTTLLPSGQLKRRSTEDTTSLQSDIPARTLRTVADSLPPPSTPKVFRSEGNVLFHRFFKQLIFRKLKHQTRPLCRNCFRSFRFLLMAGYDFPQTSDVSMPSAAAMHLNAEQALIYPLPVCSDNRLSLCLLESPGRSLSMRHAKMVYLDYTHVRIGDS